MKVNYSKNELSRFFQLHPISQFGSYVWMFHYLGVLRVVYDTKTQNWTTLPNFLNPISFLCLGVLFLTYLLWKGFSTFKEFKKKDLDYIVKIWKKKDNGSYRYLSFRKAPYYPWDDKVKENLKNRAWSKEYFIESN